MGRGDGDGQEVLIGQAVRWMGYGLASGYGLNVSPLFDVSCSSLDLLDVVNRQTVVAGASDDPIKIVRCWFKGGLNVSLACNICDGCEHLAGIAEDLNVPAEIMSVGNPLIAVHFVECILAASVGYAPDHVSHIRADIRLPCSVAPEFIENDSITDKAGTVRFSDLSDSAFHLVDVQIAAIGKIPMSFHGSTLDPC